MRNRSKLILAALTAIMLLAMAVGTAPAGHFRLTERNFEFIWDSALRNKTNLSIIDNGGHTIECKVTMLGGFTNNTIAKATGVNIGELHHVTWRMACTGGTLTFLAGTESARIRYASFAGTLPNISDITIQLLGLALRVETGLLSCLFQTEARAPAVFILEEFEVNHAFETIRADETKTIEPVCMLVAPLSFRGKGLVRNLPTTAKIAVTLI